MIDTYNDSSWRNHTNVDTNRVIVYKNEDNIFSITIIIITGTRSGTCRY